MPQAGQGTGAAVRDSEETDSKQKAEEGCDGYSVMTCSGLKSKRKRSSLKAGSSPITESFASLSTYNDQSVTFVMEEGSYEIYVEDLGKDQEKGKVLLHYYESSYSSESGDAVDGKMLMVTLSPAKDFWLHANNKEHSVELHKCKNPLPDQAFFVLHKKPYKCVSFECVSFECKSAPGTFLGVKDNQLVLINERCSENFSSENILFKLCKTM
ncbi:interleukin-33-like [Carlito syrichta]|uniref:Interleukin-33 n=1 Tax=Carlito syrichta TaxID=1868482 RepID=A0A1U7TEH2_CARSF|nr:interleukin-33-like [Carlito syrichta]